MAGKKKEETWRKIMAEFNAENINEPRDVDSLKTVYKNSKRQFKKNKAGKNVSQNNYYVV